MFIPSNRMKVLKDLNLLQNFIVYLNIILVIKIVKRIFLYIFVKGFSRNKNQIKQEKV